MTNQDNIKLLLQAINKTSDEVVSDITTSTKHKRLVISILNELCNEHPEWKTTIYALSNYTKQKWALDQTVEGKYKVQIFYDKKTELLDKYPETLDILDIINEAVYDEYFLPEDRMKIFNSKNEFMAFDAVHDLEADDVSKYIINTYYKNAVISFCKKKNKDIVKITNKSNKELSKLKEEDSIVYHDTDLFLKAVRKINKKNRVLIHFDENEVKELIQTCIKIIERFPRDGKTLASITKLYVLDNKSDLAIAKEKLVSETFVRAKRKQATDLISLILWGYFSKELYKINK